MFALLALAILRRGAILDAFKPKSWDELKDAVETCNEPQALPDSAENVEVPADTLYTEDQSAGIAGMTAKKSGWILKKEMFKYLMQMRDYDKSKYTVIDERKIHVFTVSGGQPNSARDGMLFLDSHGGRLAYMGRKASESQYTQVLMTFKPNFLGQESLESSPIGIAGGSESVPLYRYAYIESPGAKGYRFKRYVTNDKLVDAWYVREKQGLELKFDVLSVDTDEVIAQVGQDAFFTLDADTEYPLTAEKGVDRLALIGFAIACEQMMQSLVPEYRKPYPWGQPIGSTPPDLDIADGGQTEGLEGVTKRKSGWVLKQKMYNFLMSQSGREYTIVDENQKSAFKIYGKLKSKRNGILFSNAQGNKVAYLRRKAIISDMKMKVFTFSPNFEGQKMTDKSTLGQGGKSYPIYEYALIESRRTLQVNGQRTHQFTLKRRVSEIKTVDVWQGEEGVDENDKVKVDIKKAGKSEVIAQMKQEAFFSFDSTTEQAVIAAKGVDRLSLIVFAVACNKIMEQ